MQKSKQVITKGSITKENPRGSKETRISKIRKISSFSRAELLGSRLPRIRKQQPNSIYHYQLEQQAERLTKGSRRF